MTFNGSHLFTFNVPIMNVWSKSQTFKGCFPFIMNVPTISMIQKYNDSKDCPPFRMNNLTKHSMVQNTMILKILLVLY